MREAIRLFPYYGTKARLAGAYPSPRGNVIVEPFAGAASYSCRFYDREVILYEKNQIIFCLLDYLIRSTKEEIMRLPLLKVGQDVRDVPDICQEARWLIGFWLNQSSVKPCNVISTWGKNNPTAYWGVQVRERVAWSVDKIKHWKVYPESYERAACHDAKNPLWFVDPPYQHAGDIYLEPSSALDFKALGAWCRARKGQVIACENEGADWLPFKPFIKGRRQRGRDKASDNGRHVEVMWTSGLPTAGFGFL